MKKADEATRTLTNAAYLAGAQLVVPVSRGIYALFLVARLGEEAYGLLSYALGITLCALPVGAWSFELDLVRRLGLADRSGKALVRTSLRLQAILAMISGGAVIAYASCVERGAIRSAVVLFAVGLFGRLLAGWARCVLVGRERGGTVFAVESVLRLAEIVGGVVAVHLGAGVTGVAVAYATAWWVQAAIFGVAVMTLRWGEADTEAPLVSAFELLRSGVWSAVSMFALTWLRQGPLVVFRFRAPGATELGRFALVSQLLMLGGGVGAAASSAAIPMLSRAAAQGADRDADVAAGVIPPLVLSFGLAAIAIEAASSLLPGSFESVRTLLGPTVLLMLPATLAAIALHVLTARATHTAAARGLLGAAVFVTVASAILATDARLELAASGLGWCVATLLLGRALCDVPAFRTRARTAGMIILSASAVGIAFLQTRTSGGRIATLCGAAVAFVIACQIAGAFRHPIWRVLWRRVSRLRTQ